MSKQYLTFYLKELGKEEQTKPQADRKKKIIKIRAEINEKENRKIIEKIKEKKIKTWFFQINKTDKHLARRTKKEKTQIVKIRKAVKTSLLRLQKQKGLQKNMKKCTATNWRTEMEEAGS